MGKVKYVAKSFYCETCNKLEEIKDKVREDGKTRNCSCTCSAVEVWVVKEKDSWTKGIAEKYLKSEVPPVELGNINKTGECGMCGVKVKKLTYQKVGKVEFMICENCKSIMDM